MTSASTTRSYSLRHGLEAYEVRFGIDSATFAKRYLERGTVDGVDGFAAHVWLSFYEDVQRMSHTPRTHDAGSVPDLVSAA